jgi:hypothetical protein
MKPSTKQPSCKPPYEPILGPLKSKTPVPLGEILDVFPRSSRINGHTVKQRAVLDLPHRKGLRTNVDEVSDSTSVVSKGDENDDGKSALEILCLVAPQPEKL